MITFFRTIRNVELKIFADDFEYDPDVGIECGPEQIWAETLDGEDFDLTPQEEDEMSVIATDIYLSDDFI